MQLWKKKIKKTLLFWSSSPQTGYHLLQFSLFAPLSATKFWTEGFLRSWSKHVIVHFILFYPIWPLANTNLCFLNWSRRACAASTSQNTLRQTSPPPGQCRYWQQVLRLSELRLVGFLVCGKTQEQNLFPLFSQCLVIVQLADFGQGKRHGRLRSAGNKLSHLFFNRPRFHTSVAASLMAAGKNITSSNKWPVRVFI